jgi:hypothetical protein
LVLRRTRRLSAGARSGCCWPGSREITKSNRASIESVLSAPIGLVGGYAAFVFQSTEIFSEQRPQLWLCPFEELATVSRPEITCDVYLAPDDLQFSIGLANNDLESLGMKVMSFQYCDGLRRASIGVGLAC